MIPTFLVMSLALLSTPAAYAATTPPLGAAATYGVLGSTYTNTTAGTVINGDVGFTTGPAVVPGGVHTNYGSGAPYAQAGTDQGSALSALASQPCTFSFVGGAINLSTDTTHGPVGIFVPGVYCSSGAMNIGGPLTLNGNGTYIFRSVGALTTTAGAVVTLNGVCANNVFWTPTQATTLGANTTFAGSVIADAGITVGANVTWTGRSLAFGGTVTTDTDTITVPTCVAAASSSSTSSATGSVSSSSASSQVSSSVQSSSARSSSSRFSSSRSSVRSSRSSSVASSARPIFVSPVAPTPPPSPEVPLLPNTGVGPAGANIVWVAVASGFIMSLSYLFASRQAKRLSSLKN